MLWSNLFSIKNHARAIRECLQNQKWKCSQVDLIKYISLHLHLFQTLFLFCIYYSFPNCPVFSRQPLKCSKSHVPK